MKDRAPARILAGVLLLALIAGAYGVDLHYGRALFSEAVLAVFVVLALLETYALFEAKGRAPAASLGAAAAAALLLAKGYLGELVFDAPPRSADLGVVLALLLVLLARSALRRDRELALDRIGSTIAGFVYAAWLPSAALDILHLPGARPIVALRAVFWVVLVAKAADIGGYLVGKSLGRTKLIESVSPNKTVEGAAGGVVFSIAAAVGLARAFALDSLSPAFAAVAGAVLGIASQLGDLVESLLKRSAGVKDSSTRWPVFGGFLDLMDSLIVALPTGLILLQARGL